MSESIKPSIDAQVKGLLLAISEAKTLDECVAMKARIDAELENYSTGWHGCADYIIEREKEIFESYKSFVEVGATRAG